MLSFKAEKNVEKNEEGAGIGDISMIAVSRMKIFSEVSTPDIALGLLGLTN